MLEQLISTGTATRSKTGEKMDTGVKTLPDFMKDATDRNRTSPFAFTGNKFEFRMVGSKDSISACNVVLNTITAEAFKEACDVLESAEDVYKRQVPMALRMFSGPIPPARKNGRRTGGTRVQSKGSPVPPAP